MSERRFVSIRLKGSIWSGSVSLTIRSFHKLNTSHTSRRDYLKALTAGAMLTGLGWQKAETVASMKAPDGPPDGHERRIQWWREAKFGMFIHWGLYSVLGRHEWVMGDEDIPVARVRTACQAVQAQAERRARLGSPGQAGRHEIHGDDHQTP